MKAFKEWWRKKFGHRKGNDNSYLGHPEASEAWRGALEWIKKEMISLHTEQTGKVLSLDEFFKLMRKRIEEELES